jgi:hypothetical protein
VPQVCLPRGADQFANAERVQFVGAGIGLLSDEVTPENLRAALRAVLDDSGYAQAAAAMRSGIAAMPSAAEVFDELARLALSERQPRLTLGVPRAPEVSGLVCQPSCTGHAQVDQVARLSSFSCRRPRAPLERVVQEGWFAVGRHESRASFGQNRPQGRTGDRPAPAGMPSHPTMRSCWW